MKLRTFGFAFDVSNQFMRLSPVAPEYIEACKRRVAGKVKAVGPRGGLYRLVTPPNVWHEDHDSQFQRNLTVFWTKRQGRYVRPGRATAALMLDETLHFDTQSQWRPADWPSWPVESPVSA